MLEDVRFMSHVHHHYIAGGQKTLIERTKTTACYSSPTIFLQRLLEEVNTFRFIDYGIALFMVDYIYLK